MNFVLVTGPAYSVECLACQRHAIAGDLPYRNASRGETCLPDRVYADLDGRPFQAYYCQQCAAKLSVEDPTRSISRFYADTKGTEIDYARLGAE